MIPSRHFLICKSIPDYVRNEIENASKKKANRTRNFLSNNMSHDQYIEQCAKNKGLVDTDEGICFASSIDDGVAGASATPSMDCDATNEMQSTK